MVEPEQFAAWLPLAHRLMRGEEVVMNDTDEMIAPYAISQEGERTDDMEMALTGSVAVYRVEGMMLKFDTYYSYGTETLMEQLRAADQSDAIIAHVLKIDSGGGQGTNMETVARFVREGISKPVVAWFNGYCASAAYYLASAADEIYASQGTDIVGSIGVMASWGDMQPYWESLGVKFHEVYADASDLKNEDSKEAAEGKYEKLKAKVLNPHADTFRAVVREMRPGLSTDEAYRGRTYTSDDALTINMIDGIVTFQQAIARATKLATAKPDAPKYTPMENAKNIEAKLGYALNEMTDEAGNKGVFLRTEEIQQLDAAVTVEDPAAAKADAADEGVEPVAGSKTEQEANPQLTAALASIERLQASVDVLAATVTTQAKEIKKLGDAPGAKPTTVPSAGDEQPRDGEGDDDAIKALDKMALAK